MRYNFSLLPIMRSTWQRYVDHATVKNPAMTKIVTAFTLFSLGDITC